MSDFPFGGDTSTTRAWLDKYGFEDKLIGWQADAITGLSKTDLLSLVKGEEDGYRLWGFFETARKSKSGRYSF